MPFHGVLPALVTPFDASGKIDDAALERLIARQLQAGVHGLVPCGTSGEAPTLEADEHVHVVRRTVALAGAVPVLAGIGSNSTATAIRTAKEAREVGAKGVLATAPYYNKPTQEGLYRHFRAIAEAVPEVEVCVYDVPGRSAVEVATDTLVRLSEIDNVTCVKDATADLAKAAETVRAVPADFRVLSGDDFTTFPLMAVGGHGGISVACNLVPERMVQMVEAAAAGDFATAAELNRTLQPLFRALFLQTNPLPVKTALAMRGLCEEAFRLPLCPMDAAPRAALADALAAMGS